jgi:hypothetical protein
MDLPEAIARNAYVTIDRGEDGEALSARLPICSRCTNAFDGISRDDCDHEHNQTVVWLKEPNLSLLGRTFTTPRNEQGRILTQIGNDSFLCQIKRIEPQSTITFEQFLNVCSLRVVSLDVIKTWQISKDPDISQQT